MQLDTRLPLAAAAQAPITFQPESRMQTLSRIAPGINAMRQMQAQQQTQQQEMQRMMQRSAALDEMRRAVQDEDLSKYAQALMNSGDEALMQKGAQLQMADLQDKQFRRQYGGMTGNLTPEGMAALAGAGEKGLGMARELGRYVVTPQPFAVGKNVFVPGQGFQAPPEAPTPRPQPQVLRRGDVLIDPATGERIATNVPAVNALVPGAAPAAGGLTQDQTSRMLQQRGFRLRADGTAEPIPGGPADPDVLRRQAEARAAGKTPAAEKPSVTEQQAATATARLLRRATEISEALKRNPGAEAPGAIEAGVQNIPGLSIATNLVRSTDRQIVATAQDDILDALLYLATGAAYNKEQLRQQKSAYLASWSDDPPTRAAKRQRLAKMVQDAKIRAGKAWTPELDSLMETLLQSPTMRPPRTGGAGALAAPAAAPAGAGARPSLDSIFGGR